MRKKGGRLGTKAQLQVRSGGNLMTNCYCGVFEDQKKSRTAGGREVIGIERGQKLTDGGRRSNCSRFREARRNGESNSSYYCRMGGAK